MPSAETLDFLGQWLAGRDAVGRARHGGYPSHDPAGSHLAGADLRRADLTGTVFRHCDLTGARWTGSTA